MTTDVNSSRVASETSAATSSRKKKVRKPSEKQVRRRREIMDAAADVFYRIGYDASSTQDIADEVGLLKGSLYYYVQSKQDFLFEIVREIHDGALQLLDGVRAMEDGAFERLSTLIDRHVEYHSANLVKTVVFFREFRHLSPERQDLINREGDAYLMAVRDLLELGQSQGSIRADLDTRIASRGIVGMLNSIHLWFTPGGSITPDDIARQFRALLISGYVSNDRVMDEGGLAELRRLPDPPE